MTTLTTRPVHRIDIPTRDPSKELARYEPPTGGGYYYGGASTSTVDMYVVYTHEPTGTPTARIDAPRTSCLPMSGTPTLHLL